MTIKKRNYYITALVIIFGLLGLTACGKIDEISFDDTTVETTEAAPAETDAQTADAEQAEETKPQKAMVDKIDLSVSWEDSLKYDDEKEGYEREGTCKGNASSKYVDSKLFVGNDPYYDEELNILVIHMHEEFKSELYDADGKQITKDNAGIIGEFTYNDYKSRTVLDEVRVSQRGKNKDTGEIVEFKTSKVIDIDPEYIKEGVFKDVENWIDAQIDEHDGGSSGNEYQIVTDYDPIIDVINRTNLAPSIETFYCYRVERPDVPVTVALEITSMSASCLSTPPDGTKQVMEINIQNNR